MKNVMLLEAGDKVALVAMSNPQEREAEPKMKQLLKIMQDMGLIPVLGDFIYDASTGQQRAKVLMDFYRGEEIKAICDISGGDLANGVLPYLDYDEIARSNKVFWGYSDLTTVVNAIYAKTGKASVLYQVRNFVSAEHQMADEELFRINYELVQGSELRGIIVGGNIRCFLKLAGTPYMPDLTGKVLLLEARSGLAPQIETYMSHLSQIGAFDRVEGVLLGTFTGLEASQGMQSQVNILKNYVRKDLPVGVTGDIGHGTDSKAIWIGKEL